LIGKPLGQSPQKHHLSDLTIYGEITHATGSRAEVLQRKSIPFSTQKEIEHELDKREEADILEKVTHSTWVALIVAVPK
jgi:hypothetical protein